MRTLQKVQKVQKFQTVRIHTTAVAAACLLLWLTLPARAELVSHWPLDEDFEDAGPAGNPGTFFGEDVPLFVDGHDVDDEGAISLDGFDDYIEIEQNEGLPIFQHPAYSVVMWVKGLPQNDNRVYSEASTVENSSLFNIGTERGGNRGTVDIYIRTATGREAHGHTNSTLIAFDGEWHHIAWVDEDGDARLYIDGILDPTDFSYAKPALDLDYTSIGAVVRPARNPPPCCLLTGEIDAVRVYDHALTQEEILEFLPAVECPGEGDTHCDDLTIDGPDDNSPGLYEINVLSASDDGDDAIFYTFRAENDAGEVVEIGPQQASTANLNLAAGKWTITVHVDDDLLCDDEAADAVCSGEVTVVAVEPRMISHWTLDGETDDALGNNDGTFEGFDPNFVDGFNDTEEGAILFDGIDDFVNVEQNDSLPLYNLPAYSIAMWVKGLPQRDFRVWSEGSTLDRSPLFNIGTERSGTTGQVDLFIRDAAGRTAHGHTLSTAIAFDDEWHHIAWVDANGDAALYIDGVLDATDFSYTKPVLELDTTTIGGILRSTPSHWFNGAIDDVRIYNYVLSEDEVIDIMDPDDPELVASVKPGDVNGDGGFNISDAVSHLSFLFGSVPILDCYVVPNSDPPKLTEDGLAILDFNGDGSSNITDAIGALNFLFAGGEQSPHVLGQGCTEVSVACKSNCP